MSRPRVSVFAVLCWLSSPLALTLGGCTSSPAGPSAPSTVVVTVPAADPVPSSGSAAPPRSDPAASTAAVTAAVTASVATSQTPGPGQPSGPVIDVPANSPFTVFASPSGNIVCGGGKGDAGWNLRCDVNEHAWSLPPKPASCEFDWGHGTYLAGGHAGLTCVSDAIAGSDGVGLESTWWNGKPGSQVVTTDRGKVVALAYGATMRFGPIACLSQSDGVHCTDTSTGAGFDIAREAYRLR